MIEDEFKIVDLSEEEIEKMQFKDPPGLVCETKPTKMYFEHGGNVYYYDQDSDKLVLCDFSDIDINNRSFKHVN